MIEFYSFRTCIAFTTVLHSIILTLRLFLMQVVISVTIILINCMCLYLIAYLFLSNLYKINFFRYVHRSIVELFFI
ncbi:unnamed protein product [Rotaria socialis]